jgi:hypothetical protein
VRQHEGRARGVRSKRPRIRQTLVARQRWARGAKVSALVSAQVREVGVAPERLVPSAEQVSAEADGGPVHASSSHAGATAPWHGKGQSSRRRRAPKIPDTAHDIRLRSSRRVALHIVRANVVVTCRMGHRSKIDCKPSYEAMGRSGNAVPRTLGQALGVRTRRADIAKHDRHHDVA